MTGLGGTIRTENVEDLGNAILRCILWHFASKTMMSYSNNLPVKAELGLFDLGDVAVGSAKLLSLYHKTGSRICEEALIIAFPCVSYGLFSTVRGKQLRVRVGPNIPRLGLYGTHCCHR